MRAHRMDLKTVRTFSTSWEAGMAKSILEAEGIPAIVEGGAAHVLWAPSALSGVKLLVAEGALEQAQEVLRRWDESKAPSAESADAEDWSAPPESAGCDEPEDEPDGGAQSEE